MVNQKSAGDINVTMGDGNTVSQIGHTIVYHAPPPDANSIWQNGVPVGTIQSQPIIHGDQCFIEKLVVAKGFSRWIAFTIQNVYLKIESVSTTTEATIGGNNPIVTLWNVHCKIQQDSR